MTALEALEAQVRQLAQCQAAANILHTYAATLDEPNVDTVLRLFQPDAILETPGSIAAGHEEIGEFFRRAWAADPSVKRHFITSPRVTWLEPGLVRLESYFSFIGRAPDQSVLGCGTYDDTVDVTGPEPRFARMRIESHLHTDLAAGLATAFERLSLRTTEPSNDRAFERPSLRTTEPSNDRRGAFHAG